MPYMLLGCLEIAQDNNELDDWVNLLKNSGSVLREKFHSIFVKTFAQVKKQLVNDPEMQKDQKKLRRLMADRKKFGIKELEGEKDDKSDDEGAMTIPTLRTMSPSDKRLWLISLSFAPSPTSVPGLPSLRARARAPSGLAKNDLGLGGLVW
ncbi:hypothetical protein NW767_002690 [Fusarium falciforme]|nr:hypothetical protein NW767_002690 [Fusarium falciforme]